MRILWTITWLALASLTLGCGPKWVTTPVHEGSGVSVLLRHQEKGGEPLPGRWAHPVEISDVRVAHVLASFTHEREKDVRFPTLRTEHVFDLAEGISKALGQATPADEVVAVVQLRDRNMGIFTDHKVTAFRCYQHGDELVFDFFAIEKDISPKPGKAPDDEYKLPDELPELPLPERLIPGEAQVRHGNRGLAVRWRDEYYRRPAALRFQDGRAKRRTILMESDTSLPLPEAGDAPTPSASQVEQQLKALDALDEARRRGELSEADYQRRRREILEGQVQDGSGDGSEP